MNAPTSWKKLAPDLFLFADACNIYLLRDGDRAIAVDFGTGRWLSCLDQIGVAQLEHVVLTHAHRDQCCGLYQQPHSSFVVHAPTGDSDLLEPAPLNQFWHSYQSNGCPSSYAAPRLPLEEVRTDMAADSERLIGPARFCGIATPGHTRGALSYIVEWRGRHLAFCGDAVHAGGTLHQPYHLEWDHWTPEGALAAWYGLERLRYCYFDLLLPSHGAIVEQQPRSCVTQTQKKLLRLIRAKGSVCVGEKNRWLDLEPMASTGASRVLPHLYHFGGNSFLLIGKNGTGMVVDPTLGSIHQLEPLMREIGLERIEVTTASHYHLDHSDALNQVRAHYNAAVWLHPWVAAPICDRNRYDLPWLPAESIVPDRLLPETGAFRWDAYRFEIRPFPGQTWWHCAFDTLIDNRHVLFSGDNFQPPTRWNGTGGFCAFNGSRFSRGFAPSARAASAINPAIVCNGHGNIYTFARSHYRRILHWAARTEKTLEALCPSPVWMADYDCRATHWEPFVSQARPRQTLRLTLVHHNYQTREVTLLVSPCGPHGWSPTPARRRMRVPAGKSRRLNFTLQLPRNVDKGRYLIAADVELDGHPQGEVCVALIDI